MNCHKISTFGTMLCLLGLGFSDTAIGQVLTASPSSMGFTVESGGATSTQNVTITYVNGATTLYLSTVGSPTWLTVDGLSSGSTTYLNTPTSGGGAVIPVTVNTAGLNTGQVYNGTFTVQVNGLPSSLITYQVGLTVGNPSLLSANPESLTFSAVQGSQSGTPSATSVFIMSSGAQLQYTVSAATANGSGNWILLTNTSGTTSNGEAAFQVQVNPSLLAVGNYTGTVTVQSTTTSDSATIPVSLSVTAGSALNVTGTLNTYVFQAGSGEGSFSPETQSLMISTTSGNLYYQVTATATAPQNTNWLVLNQTGGLATTTPQVLTLSLSYQYVAALPAGTYTINLAIAPTGNIGGGTNVAVTLVVTNDALLSTSTNSVSFSVPFGNSSQSKSVNVTSTGSSIQYLVTTNQSWLTVEPSSGATPGVFTIVANPTNLSPSSTPYTGTVTVYPNNADYYLYNIPIAVSLTVTGATTQIYAAPGALLFSDQTTQSTSTSLSQLVELTSTSAVAFTISSAVTPASNCPSANWLGYSESQASTPATLSISVATTGMTAGSCSGTVTVTYNSGNSASATVSIPVTVNIASTALLTVTPDSGFGVVTATYGSSASISSRISVNSTDGSALSFSATASTPDAPVSWLYLGSSSGTTQQYIQVQISPIGLPVGVYNGSITINATNSASLPSGSFTLPVVLTVSANTTVAVTPTSLSFTQAQGAAPPAAQQLTLTATGGSTTYTAAVTQVTGGNWLQISPESGTATTSPSTIAATVAQNTLSPGTYKSTITLTFLNSASPTTTIPVTLTVTSAQTVSVSPTSLSFSYQLGSAAPATQSLNVTSTGGAVTVSVGSTSTSGSWLSVTPSSGTTGQSGSALVLTVSVAPAALTLVQTYSGTITITPAGQSAITVPVTVAVTGVPVPQPGTIANSASQTFGAIAVGELITIKGTNLGPATPASFIVAAGNTVSNNLAGVQVLFDGIPGTPTYVSSSQINAIVPYEIAGRATTNVVVSYQSQESAPIPQNVTNQAPGIYTFSATGSGQAAVLNQNYSLNGPSVGLVLNGTPINTTPAAPNSVIVVYLTGGGQTNPASVTGTVTPSSPYYYVPTTVSATINGVNAPVQFAGAAPGEVTGVIQFNITVPNVSGNALPLAVTINGVTSPFGPTVAVQ